MLIYVDPFGLYLVMCVKQRLTYAFGYAGTESPSADDNRTPSRKASLRCVCVCLCELSVWICVTLSEVCACTCASMCVGLRLTYLNVMPCMCLCVTVLVIENDQAPSFVLLVNIRSQYKILYKHPPLCCFLKYLQPI